MRPDKSHGVRDVAAYLPPVESEDVGNVCHKNESDVIYFSMNKHYEKGVVFLYQEKNYSFACMFLTIP
ncbi:hypothetical protein AYO36_01245 [Exiguobacterium sp. KKBO11]|nr:hypothetical protein AYO36_01245 [Exiguobacterium sp. KKBO11]